MQVCQKDNLRTGVTKTSEQASTAIRMLFMLFFPPILDTAIITSNNREALSSSDDKIGIFECLLFETESETETDNSEFQCKDGIWNACRIDSMNNNNNNNI
jgi:hypothetical protein